MEKINGLEERMGKAIMTNQNLDCMPQDNKPHEGCLRYIPELISCGTLHDWSVAFQ